MLIEDLLIRAGVIIATLTSVSFIFQALTEKNWRKAWEKSFDQATAVIITLSTVGL